MNYPQFPKECKSLLCKYLTPEVFEALKDKKTANGFTLEQAINSGVQNIDSGIGVYAGDKESYSVLACCLTLLSKSIMDSPKRIHIKAISARMIFMRQILTRKGNISFLQE
jgi:hypothetical protein